MRLQWALLLGALAGVHAQDFIKRQDNNSDSASVEPPASTSSEAPDSTSSSAPESTSSQPPPSSSSGSDDDEDTTVLRTVTVTNEDVETVSRATTVFSTSTTTVFVTSTAVETSTVTSDGDVSTTTSWVTVTSTVQKRSLAVRTLDAEDREVPAPAPFTTVPSDWYAPRAAQDPHLLGKRATITQLTTVTEGSGGGATTVFSTALRRVVSTVTDETTTTTTIIETFRPNAKSTSTVTSTLTVTSTAKGSGGVSTSDPEPTSGSGSGGSDNNNGGNSDSNKDNGLSTGAKAGIGAGAGVAGLAIIGALAWFLLRRRRDPKPDHDDLIGASEVPVGGPVGSSGHSGPSAAHHSAAAAFLAPGRTQTKASHSPEGYRGTAMGDGRSGFAKPSPYGSAYAPASSTSPTTAYSQPTDYDYSGHTDRGSTMVSTASPDGLPEHPTPQSAAEIDSRPAPAHHDGPVYEMPGQPYR